ncbi:MAG: WYL domain-containing protein [Pseudomonadota bacterium]|nr:WYL domain-containing protein [Pseudomonadota bacterium]
MVHVAHAGADGEDRDRIVVVCLPMLRAPTANSFTSATAIFRILERVEDRGATTVKWVRKELEVSARQARDYLGFLEARGRVRVSLRGRTNEYHLAGDGDGGGDVLQQAVGAEFAVAALGSLKGTAFHDAAVGHVAALRRGLREVHSRRAGRLRSAFYAVRGSTPTNTHHAAHAEEILDALMHGHALRAKYEVVSNGEVRSYTLRPLWLVVDEGLHLVARRRDGKVRTFDVEGFREVERVKRNTSPTDIDVERYFADAFGRYTDFPAHEVSLRFVGKAARQVRRRSFHPSQVITEDNGDQLVARFRLGLCPEFTSWLLGLSPDVEVLAPEELRQEVRERHAAGASRNAGAP